MRANLAELLSGLQPACPPVAPCQHIQLWGGGCSPWIGGSSRQEGDAEGAVPAPCHHLPLGLCYCSKRHHRAQLDAAPSPAPAGFSSCTAPLQGWHCTSPTPALAPVSLGPMPAGDTSSPALSQPPAPGAGGDACPLCACCPGHGAVLELLPRSTGHLDFCQRVRWHWQAAACSSSLGLCPGLSARSSPQVTPALLFIPVGRQAHGQARVLQLMAPAAAMSQELLPGGGHSAVLSPSGHPGHSAMHALVLALTRSPGVLQGPAVPGLLQHRRDAVPTPPLPW